MRLRITVRRHGLPDTRVVFPIDTSGAAAPTISKLLEELNDFIPVEAGEWGFEDYAVEVYGGNGGSYECLHYQLVGSVLREDDEVIIRPLLTHDLKSRKLSGRHQISSDGKHLVDGLAFGRPLLRRPLDRPMVTIPPRKKARITYEVEGDEEGDDVVRYLAVEGARQELVNGGMGGRELVLHADFEDEDEEDDEEDDDFEPGGEEGEEEDESDEDTDGVGEGSDYSKSSSADSDRGGGGVRADFMEDLQDEESHEESAADAVSEVIETAIPPAESAEVAEQALADVPDKSTRAKIQALNAAFPGSAMAVCKHVLIGTNGDAAEAYEALSGGFKSAQSKRAVLESLRSQRKLRVPKTRSRNASAPKETSTERQAADDESVETDDKLMEYYDTNGLPEGSITSGRALSVMAEVVENTPRKRTKLSASSPFNGHRDPSSVIESSISQAPTSTPFIDLTPQHGESNNEDSEISSSGKSSSSSSSSDEDSSSDDSSEDESDETDQYRTSTSGSDSDSSSDASSDGEEAPEETSSKTEPGPSPETQKPTEPKEDEAKPNPKPAKSAPEQGLNSTKSRNRRRKTAIAHKRFIERGELPADTTREEFKQLGIVTGDVRPENALAALNALRASKLAEVLGDAAAKPQSKAQDFDARRNVLLTCLETGGIDVNDKGLDVAKFSQLESRRSRLASASAEMDLSAPQQDVNSMSAAPEDQHPAQEANTLNDEVELGDSGSKPLVFKEESTTASSPKSQPVSVPSSHEVSTPARRKLDLGAGRRMLFGALGIKTPKTKTDEDKIRSDLMKHVRPILPPKEQPLPTPAEKNATDDEDPEAWREKIIYRAVECCDEGVVLSEPPFPFVQRWDPQQQGSWTQSDRNGPKKKRKLRDEPQFYEEGVSKKKKRRKGKHSYTEEQELLDYDESFQDSVVGDQFDSQQPSSGEKGHDDRGEIDQQLMNDLTAPGINDATQAPEDLAPLPADPSVLPDLRVESAKIGMTIVFKELSMSAATKWQPELSDWRTAIVIALPSPGELNLKLAIRDRITSEKKYDEETGERIYGKFEMPDDDEEDEFQEDDGTLFLSYSQMRSPKILQEPPLDLVVPGERGEEPEHGPEDRPLSIESTTMSHEEPLQFSIVAETLLQSDVAERMVSEAGSDIEHVADGVGGVPDESNELGNESVADTGDEPAIEPGNKQVTEPQTPATLGKVPAADASSTSKPISDENRHEISLLMREAGFNSSIPSSVLRDMQLNSVPTPGDEAAFERLMRDMTSNDGNETHLPFRGHGSSPTPNQQSTLLRSPSPEDVFQEVENEQLEHRATENESTVTPAKIQSSWETVESFSVSPASSIGEAADETSEVEEENPRSSWEDVPSSSPVGVRGKSASKPQKSAMKVPVSKAQALWQALQGRKRKVATSSPARSGLPSAEQDQATTVDQSRDSGPSIEYPKIAIGSSFTSQNTERDHGRQPDFVFEETLKSIEPLRAATDKSISTSQKSTQWNEIRGSSLRSSVGHIASQRSNQIASILDLELMRQGAVAVKDEASAKRPMKRKNPSSGEGPYSAVDSSDSSLPPMDVLCSQQSMVNPMKPKGSIPKQSVTKSSSHSSPQPKAREKSRMARKDPGVKSAATRREVPKTNGSSSQSSVSQTRNLSEIPANSQFVDLTFSSDVEAGDQADGEDGESDDAAVDDSESRLKNINNVRASRDSAMDSVRSFKSYDMDLESPIEQTFGKEQGGWRPKTETSLKGVGIMGRNSGAVRVNVQGQGFKKEVVKTKGVKSVKGSGKRVPRF